MLLNFQNKSVNKSKKVLDKTLPVSFYNWFQKSFPSSECQKKLSTTALSRQSPLRLILERILYFRFYAMKPPSSSHRQLEFFRPVLSTIVDPNHALVKLSHSIDWRRLQELFGETCCPDSGWPGKGAAWLS